MGVIQFVKRLCLIPPASGKWFFAFALFLCFDFSAGAQPYGLDSRPAIGPFLNGTMPETAPGISGDWSAVAAFPNLLFTNSVGLTFVPGTDELASGNVRDGSGPLKIRPNATEKKLVLDLTTNARAGTIPVCWAWRFIRALRRTITFMCITPGSSRARSPAMPIRGPTRLSTDTYHDRLSRFTLDTNGVADSRVGSRC